MSVICIHRSHELSLLEWKEKIDNILLDISERLDFKSEWQSDRSLSFRRKGANGGIEISDVDFEFTLRLGMMFRMMKVPIQKEVIEVIDRHIKWWLP